MRPSFSLGVIAVGYGRTGDIDEQWMREPCVRKRTSEFVDRRRTFHRRQRTRRSSDVPSGARTSPKC